MHYKKQLLLAGGNNSSTSSTKASESSSALSANFDVTRSLTDQLTQLAKAEKIVVGGGDGKGDSDPNTQRTTVGKADASLCSVVPSSDQESKHNDLFTVKHIETSVFNTVRSISSRSNASSSSEERAEFSASDSQVSSVLDDDRRPGSQLGLNSGKSSRTSSPLFVERSCPVNVYRDPVLMSKNPVRSVLNNSTVHRTMSSPSYPTVPGVPAAPQVLSSSTTHSSHPSPIPRSLLPALAYSPHHLPPAGVSHALPLPHAYSQIDALAARELLAQHQQLAALQQHYQNAALMHPVPYPLPSAHRMAQLELLWQQKFPHAPLPPARVLAKHPEGVFGDTLLSREQLERFEQERIEHDRLEKRLELEKAERERAERQEREQKEKRDQIERERQEKEREKMEQEKADRERGDRERQERERKEKERRERERLMEQREWELQQRHLERERILRESKETSAQAAVDEHFVESFRLAKLKGVAPTAWASPSITKGTGKGLKIETDKTVSEDWMKREVDQRTAMSEDKGYMADVKDKQRSDHIAEVMVDKDGRPMYNVASHHPDSFPQTFTKAQPGSLTKPEAIFSLYGYQSQQYSTMTTEQLQKKGLAPGFRPVKEEKDKDIKMQSSVIVENKVKMEKQSHAPYSYQPSILPSSSTCPHPRPAHTPDQRHDHPLSSSSNQTNCLPQHLVSPDNASNRQNVHPTAFHSAGRKVSGESTNPYKMGSVLSVPTSSQRDLNAPINFSSKLYKGQNELASNTYPATVALTQAHVSLSGTGTTYSHSLIQQGLVPNPMYSQGAVPTSIQTTHNRPDTSANLNTNISSATLLNYAPVSQSMPQSLQVSKSSQNSPPGVKRKTSIPGIEHDAAQSNKRSKTAITAVDSCRAGSTVSVPVTTPQILTNPSPYSFSSNSTANMNKRTNFPSNSPIGVPPIRGFIDSFRSFVENTVQNAYLQDAKTTIEKEEQERLYKQQELQIEPSCVENKDTIYSSENCEKVSKSPSRTVGGQSAVQQLPISSIPSNLDSAIKRTSPDAESDAPSPSRPTGTGNSSPQLRGTSSCAPRLKKAWLMRHADDEKPAMSPKVLSSEDSNQSHSITCEGVKQENVSSNGSSSPSLTRNITTNSRSANVGVSSSGNSFTNNTANADESTSSASETESQASTTSAKKRSKSRKTPASKKVKNQQPPSSPSPQCSSSNANGSRSKKTANKKVKQEKPNHRQKDKEASSFAPSPSSTPPPQSTKSNTDHSTLSHKGKGSKTMSSKQSEDVSSPSVSGDMEEETQADGHNDQEKKKTRRNKDASSRSGQQGTYFNKPLVKCSVASLKRSGAPFIQDGSCCELTPKLSKCRECKMTPNQRSKKIPNIFCRFYAFRRLKYNNKGTVTIAGFSELSDADPDHLEPWLPKFPPEEPALDGDMAKFILSKVGDKFCELVQQEKEAKCLPGVDSVIAWKRAVTGVREMCDVCDTTLFNMHWVCHKCGFVVCLDCYKAKMKATEDDEEDCRWLTCSSNRQAHEAKKLMLTQIIPSDALWELGRLIHDIRHKWSIPAKCSCKINDGESKLAIQNGVNQAKKLVNGMAEEVGHKKSKKAAAVTTRSKEEEKLTRDDCNQDKLALLANVALGDGEKPNKRSRLDKHAEDDVAEDGDKKSGCSTLRELLTKTAGKGKMASEKKSKPKSSCSTLDDIIQSVVEKRCRDLDQPNQTFKFLHYIPRLGQWNRELPIIAHSLTETSVLYPDVPHSWLCDGRLLRLHDPQHRGNLRIFQEQWKRGQPVLVSCVDKIVNTELWKPCAFSKEFGEQDNDLVNCRVGDIIVDHPMKDFWDGFESIENRLMDENDEPMLLKLKDWPPGDDFSELLPSLFKDLMQALPLPEYTRRDGNLNLASRLPDFLVRPDLGPKMYNAYGSARYPKEGTTNLHLDISDAVNVLVYVGVPNDGVDGRKGHEDAAVKAIDEAGCDSITKRRVREVHELPGALWQIYDAHDADKIRDFLNKVAKERGETIEQDHDSIHDQSWYLDEELRDRLFKEYGVQGYTIVQCMGDAIFIPAGAPHQVRNLHSCIKVAEDFVSPEHLNNCFRLTQEFRQLSDTHSNHEDKLQVKNIIYHAVKDSLAVLRELEPEEEN